jgi:glucose uptake protein
MVVTSTAAALALMLLSMTCWGSWANTYKLAGTVRFELFYWDYAIGLALTAIALAFYSDGAALLPELRAATSTALWEAVAAGVVFNLANLLLVAAIALAGLAVAFPLGIGTALIVGTALTFLVDRKGTPGYIVVGVALAVIAIVACATAYRRQAGGLTVTRKGVIICLVSGILMACWAPLAAASMRGGPGGLSTFSSLAVFAVGALLSTIPFNLYFMRRPLSGEPVALRAYGSGGARWHLLGLLGGVIWTVGTAANLVAGHATGFAVSYAIGQSAPLVASLWGIFVWREFSPITGAVARPLIAMYVFYAAAILVLSRAL